MPRVVPAVARTLEILGLFLGSRTLSVPEMSVRLDLPRSTAHELVHTLVSRGFLVAVEDQPRRFALGLRVFELGSSYAANVDLISQGMAVVREISRACDETVQLAVLDCNQVVYVAKIENSHPVRVVSSVGSRLPAHLTASGKVLLSGLSDGLVMARYDSTRSLPGMTPNSITTMDRLLGELATVRAQGWAMEDREAYMDVQSVAALVYDEAGAPVAAISIAVPVARMSPERQVELVGIVREGAERLSNRLGHGAAKCAAELSGKSPGHAG